ncbi:hypothetical protein EC973_002283 [Apophysomyces ossiformis]|uniref:Phospholipid scramblase n=1 Tax=Apophysomyces ossiformis TaxID=679940 RepID=A0A8H7ERC4_9FUNG|nr:hypothetical protein EC973_002283 [Apophysomyces ossiformis]
MYRSVAALRPANRSLTNAIERSLSRIGNTARPSTQPYSSLRRTPRSGPRGRILNHIEDLRVKRPIGVATQTAPNLAEAPVASEASQTVAEIPPAKEGQVITHDYRGAPLLAQSALVVGRELEMMNVFLGYEQANRYKVIDPNGNNIGYIAEEEGSIGTAIGRQFMRTHRPFKATIMNSQGEVIFKIVRPFAFINSRIYIYTADDTLVGEVQQRWHLLRRKYDLFVGKTQFAAIDTPTLGWDFNLEDENGGVLGNVSRNFVGFAREIFTDTGEYVLRMDAVEGNSRGMTLDERAVTLACAVSIDFDYFSRHSSHSHGGIIPFPFFGFGGERESPSPTNESPSQQEPPSDWDNDDDDTPKTNEYGDIWMDDEAAGVQSPVDDLRGFFKDILDS